MTSSEPTLTLADSGLRAKVYGGFEYFWSLGFFIAGSIARPSLRVWSSAGNQRILIIAPHPDDEIMGCAGTIFKHKRWNDQVWVAYVTDGRKSRAMGLTADEMARRRKQEAEKCAKRLGLDRMIWMAFHEGEWERTEVQAGIRSILIACQPHIIYAPSRIDFHPEHILVAQSTSEAIEAEASVLDSTIIRVYQIQVPLTPVLTNIISPLDRTTPVVSEVFRIYQSQSGSIQRAMRMRKYSTCFYRTDSAVEEFWEISPQVYRKLHRIDERQPNNFRFRGLRGGSWSDPLAYLTGLRARLELARLVSGSAGREM